MDRNQGQLSGRASRQSLKTEAQFGRDGLHCLPLSCCPRPERTAIYVSPMAIACLHVRNFQASYIIILHKSELQSGLLSVRF
jgi:hypothetical protein